MAKKLRESGAIILGKSNMSQWANYRSTNSTNGWSAYGGQVYGVYYPFMDPSGSSSGSGVASAPGLAAASLGTKSVTRIRYLSLHPETIIDSLLDCGMNCRTIIQKQPGWYQAYCWLDLSSPRDPNLKFVPLVSEFLNFLGANQFTRSSRYNRLPYPFLSPSLAISDPLTSNRRKSHLARTVKDVAIVLGAIAGVDPKDNYTEAIPDGKVPDYVAALNADALQGARLSIPYGVLTGPQVELCAFNAAVALMKSAGAVIVNATYPLPPSNGSAIVQASDFASDLAAYLSELMVNPLRLKSLGMLGSLTRSFHWRSIQTEIRNNGCGA